MTTALENRETVLVSIDPKEVSSLLNIDPIASLERLDIKLSRMPQDDGTFSKDDFIKQLTRHESELFTWLAAKPANGKEFIADPLGTFQRHTTALPAFVEKIKTAAAQKGNQGTDDPRVDPDTPATPPLDTWIWDAKTFLMEHLIDAGDTFYVGGNKSIYKLSAADGRVMLHADLGDDAYSDQIRMVISEDKQRLFVGFNRDVSCFRASDLVRLWTYRFARLRYDLVLNGNDLYVGAQGKVIKLDARSGVLAHEVSLKHELDVRLALADDKTHLFAGNGGWAMCLDPADLRVRWRSDLDDTKRDRITILTRGAELYAAGRGHLFTLDFSDGTAQHTMDLGEGHHDVSMAFAGEGKSLLLGIHNHVLSWTPGNAAFTWKSALIGDPIKYDDGNITLAAGGVGVYAATANRWHRLLVSDGRITFSGHIVSQEPGPNAACAMALTRNNTHLVIAYRTCVQQVPVFGNLLEGWEAIIAMRRAAVNETLAALLSAVSMETGVVVAGVAYKVSVRIENAPEIVSGENDMLVLRVTPLGTVSSDAPGAEASEIQEGYVDLRIDLTKIHARVARKDTPEDFELELTFESGVFAAIDVSHLKMKPVMKVAAASFAAALLAVANSRIAKAEVTMPIVVPSIRDGLVACIVYTNVPKPQDDVLTFLFGLSDDQGTVKPAPTVLSPTTDLAFALSNYWTMQGINAALNSDDDDDNEDAKGLDFGFEVSNEYPACISNSREIKIDNLPYVWMKIRKRQMQMYIHKDAFHADVRISYRNVLTLMFWHDGRATSTTSFAASEDGNVGVQLAYQLHIPWLMYLISPLGWILSRLWHIAGIAVKKIVKKKLKKKFPVLINNKGKVEIYVPYVDISSISMPAYVHATGKLKLDKKAPDA